MIVIAQSSPGHKMQQAGVAGLHLMRAMVHVLQLLLHSAALQ